MKKARNNYEEEAYEDDDYYDDDYEDDYYEEQEEEEEKPKKKKNANKNNQNNKQTKNDNNKNQQKNQSSNTQSKENSKINSLNVSKKDSNISSSLSLSPSSSSSINNSAKEKEKEIKTLKDYNNLESYPKIDYGSNKINQEEKPTINLVIIGHVDSGKSTMIGHLMFLLGLIDQKDFKKKLKVGNQTKDSMQFAYVTDESTSERERGVTIDIGYKTFSTKNRNVLALDAPGHQDFIHNMIAGTCLADYALLVIDSGLNAFDAGFYKEGRTKEHALLAKTLGVSKLIVAINKLELFN